VKEVKTAALAEIIPDPKAEGAKESERLLNGVATISSSAWSAT